MSSTSHAPSENVILASLGNAFLDVITQTLTFAVIYGVFVLLFAQVTATFFRKHFEEKAKSREYFGSRAHFWKTARTWVFMASALNFLLATVHVATNFAILGIFVHSALVGYQDIPLAAKPPVVNGLLLKPNIVLVWMASFEPLISDSIVVWKAFVLLRGRKWLRFPPLLLLLCSLALALVNLVFATKQHNIDQWLVKTSLTISGGLSLGTNMVATSLIGYVYWSHRKSMVANLGRERRPTQSERVLALLVESGAVFCLPQAIYFITQLFPELVVGDTPGHYARQVFNATYFIFSAMYPTLVAALTNGRSAIDEAYPSVSALLPTRQYDAPNRTNPLTLALPEAAEKTMESPGTSNRR